MYICISVYIYIYIYIYIYLPDGFYHLIAIPSSFFALCDVCLCPKGPAPEGFFCLFCCCSFLLFFLFFFFSFFVLLLLCRFNSLYD